MYYVYVLENDSEELYYGSTNDLRRRLAQHRRGHTTTTKNGDWTLIYYEAYRTKSDARRREDQLKMHGQAKRQLKDRIRASRRGQS
ncbi:MAG TPA: GIY-YIG nuclease family protein [Candidatus Paceibacterota bacterium]|nr:GIY-YIG nuclease family protein [Candidatus Paceibacterota bacterium]